LIRARWRWSARLIFRRRGRKIKVLTAGAFKQVRLCARVAAYEIRLGKQGTGGERILVGAVVKRINVETTFDVVIVSPQRSDDLARTARWFAGSISDLREAAFGIVDQWTAPLRPVHQAPSTLFKRAMIAPIRSPTSIPPAEDRRIFVDRLPGQARGDRR